MIDDDDDESGTKFGKASISLAGVSVIHLIRRRGRWGLFANPVCSATPCAGSLLASKRQQETQHNESSAMPFVISLHIHRFVLHFDTIQYVTLVVSDRFLLTKTKSKNSTTTTTTTTVTALYKTPKHNHHHGIRH